MRPRAAALVALVGSALASREAAANGRFPQASQLVVDPSDARHVVVRTTYGTLHSRDGGASFAWVCDGALGAMNRDDPAIGVVAGDAILGGVRSGLSVSRDAACTWAFAGGPLAGQWIVDVVVRQDDPTRAFALASSYLSAGRFRTFVAATSDAARTWTITGDLGGDLLAATIEVARSDPRRVYASGIAGSPAVAYVARSDDAGATWARHQVPLGAALGAYLSAVDPRTPDRVYVRLDGATSDTLLVSDDGALTFRTAYAAKGKLLGFALSPDGARIAIGGPDDGVLTAGSADLSFAARSGVQARCLTWSAAGLYACATESVDHFTIGVSSDEGATFRALHHLGDPCPLACAAGTSAGDLCAAEWPAAASSIGASDAGCAPDGAAGDAAPTDDAGDGGDAGPAGAPGAVDAGTTSDAGDDAGGASGCAAAPGGRAPIALIGALFGWIALALARLTSARR